MIISSVVDLMGAVWSTLAYLPIIMHQNHIIFRILPSLGLIVVTVGKIPWGFGTSIQSGMERMCAGGGSVFYPHGINTGIYLGLKGRRHYK